MQNKGYTRRQFMLATAAAAGLPMLSSCSGPNTGIGYEQAVVETWQHGADDFSDRLTLQHELVRYATLAPSSHNTQCWKFHVKPDAISILPDYDRHCPAVDPDNHHLFVSLGCAAENLMQAAAAHGLHTQLRHDYASNAIEITLERAPPATSDLFNAIPQRQSTRAEYDGKALSPAELLVLSKIASGPGIELLLLTDKGVIESILGYVVAANSLQMQDAAFVKELKLWLRFNRHSAISTGDGLFSETTGNPSLPDWLASVLFDGLYTANNENDKYAQQLRSSAGIAVFVSDANTPADWVQVGRCYERFALQCTALGIRNAFINQPVEVATIRNQLANYLNLRGRRPDLLVRFGRGPRMPQSLRRPLQSVLV